MTQYSLADVSDAALLRELKALLGGEREKTASLLAHVAEVDDRRLYAPAGYSSMYTYCTGELRLSEDAAWRRIQAARAARRVPILFSAIAEGRLHLTAACLIASHLTIENANELVEAATGRTRSEIQAWLATRFPQSVAPAPVLSIRPIAVAPPRATEIPGAINFDSPALARVKSTTPVSTEERAAAVRESEQAAGGSDLRMAGGNDVWEPRQQRTDGPAPAGGASLPTPAGGAGLPTPAGGVRLPTPAGGASLPTSAGGASLPTPAPASFLLQVTIPKSTHDKLCRAQVLLSHAVAARDVAQVLDRALDALIEKLEKRKLGATSSPRPVSSRVRHGGVGKADSPRRDRYVPSHVRRFVWSRDQGRCTFVGTDGHRCEERKFLEFDHVQPVARGGTSTRDGLRLRCRAHNQYAADQAFGQEFMGRKRKRGRSDAGGAREATPAAVPHSPSVSEESSS